VQQKSSTLEFRSLPLIEVALKRVYRSQLPVNLPFILAIRESHPSGFDTILDLQGFEQPPAGLQAPQLAFPSTHGCRFIDSSRGITVILQPDMLIARWQSDSGTDYPRFDALSGALDTVTGAFPRIGSWSFKPAVINLAYANRIAVNQTGDGAQPDPWPLSQAWTPPNLMQFGVALESQFVMRGTDKIDRRVQVQFRSEPEQPPWYLLLTVAGKQVEDNESVESCENKVHGALIDWFPELLSAEAREAYELQL
jgi:hypothetical protein